MEATDDEGRALALGGAKQRGVLAILLLSANEVVSAERLIEELWSGEPPARAAKTLHVHISRLRSALGDGRADRDQRIVTALGGYQLRVSPGELDRDRFERMVADGDAATEAGDWELASSRFRGALDLWRGQPLSGLEYESFAQAEITRLSELKVTAAERLIEAELRLGHDAGVIGELERLVRGHPYREQLRGQLMLALYRVGRQADALAAYRDARSELVEELGIEPSSKLRRLNEQILAQDPALLRSSDVAGSRPQVATGPGPTNLSPPTRRLLGRARERAELRGLLEGDQASVVTITGIGGIGKTRLAVAVAGDLLEHAPGGVFLVRFAGIHDPDSILPMIADAVGVAGQGAESLESVLVRRLGEQPTILVLDNFEQLVAGASIVADLVARAEHLRVLVTSQVRLRIGAEQTFPLGPLAAADAAKLFIERARTRRHEFSPSDDDRREIEGICVQVEHMPLAIELAAARIGVLSSRELARRLDRPLAVLTQGTRDAPERQRSLRAAIDWTHGLLSPGQQSLFACLGVCAGAVGLEFVEAISPHGSSPETLDALDELLACSFVRRREDERVGARFLVPQALRDYALERLIESGTEPEVRRLHAEHVQRLGQAARLWKWGATVEERTAVLAAGDEIRPAVAWARNHDPELHVRICSALCSYWTYAGVLAEVRSELARARDSGCGCAADQAWLTTLLAKLAQLLGDHAVAHELMAAAIDEWQAVDDDHERALGLGPLSWVVRWEERHEEAIALARESLEVLRRSGEPRLVLRGLVFLAHTLADSGNFAAAQEVLAEADERAGGDPVWELAAIHGDFAELRGDHLAALALFADSLSWTSTTGESHQMVMDLRSIVINLARAGFSEPALEAHELTRLEERRTGRTVTTAGWAAKLDDAIAVARAAVSDTAAGAAGDRADGVEAAQRPRRAIELARSAVGASTGSSRTAEAPG